LAKPQGTTTYCWRPEEVQAMLQRCRQQPELGWLGDVLTALACTGLRIAELAALRCSDLDWDRNVVRLTARSTEGRGRRGPGRPTKSGGSRSFPMHEELRRVLKPLPRSTDGLLMQVGSARPGMRHR